MELVEKKTKQLEYTVNLTKRELKLVRNGLHILRKYSPSIYAHVLGQLIIDANNILTGDSNENT